MVSPNCLLNFILADGLVRTMKNQLEKSFTQFSNGLFELVEISFSARQEIENGLELITLADGATPINFSFVTEEMVVAALAANTISDRTGSHGIRVSAVSCDYLLVRGVSFGWEVNTSGTFGDNVDLSNVSWRFWIIPPKRELDYSSATRRARAIKKEWRVIV